MNCNRIRELLPEFIDGKILAAPAVEIDAHLKGCAACHTECESLRRTLDALDALPEPAPSGRLRENLLASIEAEKHALNGDRQIKTTRSRKQSLSWLRIAGQGLAACALLGLGYVAGMRHSPAESAPHEDGTRQQIADLQKRVDSMGQLVSYSLLQNEQQSSANDRLQTVLTSATLHRPSDTVIDSLVSTLALDPSVNCRLSAVEALYAYSDNAVVGTAIRLSLPREQNPLVQLAMIDFLTAVHDHDASPVLQTLSSDTLIDKSVRDAAGRALTEL
jgi:putative zinc finger protein